jgi:hypothetical protein
MNRNNILNKNTKWNHNKEFGWSIILVLFVLYWFILNN